VAGSRDWPDPMEVHRQLDQARSQLGEFTLVHGACPTGADKFADDWGRLAGVAVERHPAQRDRHSAECPDWHLSQPRCKAAGFRRNREMVQFGADLCLVFIHANSRGSRDTARQASAAGIQTWVFVPGETPRLLG